MINQQSFSDGEYVQLSLCNFWLLIVFQAIDEKIRELSNCHIVYPGIDFQKVRVMYDEHAYMYFTIEVHDIIYHIKFDQ